VTIKITNMSPNSGATAKLFLYGVGTVKRTVNMTGRGGWKTSDLLGDIQNRILQYTPDVLFLAIGSNDTYYEVPVATYKANLESIITQTRAANTNAEMVLITSSYMTANQSGAITADFYKPYNKALHELAAKYNCYYIDMIDFFKNYDVSLWRFDTVHLNKLGNTMFANYIIGKLMPTGSYNPKYINSYLSYTSSRRSEALVKKEFHGLHVATWDGVGTNTFTFTNTYSTNDNVLSTVSKDGTTVYRLNVKMSIDESRIGRYPFVSQFVNATVKQACPLILDPVGVTTGTETFMYNIYRIESGVLRTVTQADWDNNPTAFVFQISY
jgi:hypothetical protein